MMTMMRCNATYVLVLLMATAGATAARSEVEHDIIENEEYEQFGCTSYYNTGASVRPPNTKYDDDGAGFTAETCDQACKDQGYSFFGFECPMTNEVHCQCYTAQSVGEDKPLERANCKAEVGRDGDKHCTGPAMINGISLGGADIGSIYKVTTFAIANQEETDCLEVPPEPILQETIGSVLNSNAFLDDAVQIVGSGFDSDNDVDYVAFTVNQLWNKEGLPMIAVSYAEGNQGEMVCDMQTSSSLGLIEFESVTKYSAQCAHGYAEISVYLYVGDSDDFNIEECESCAAPDNNYVGYYLLLPCDHICEEVKEVFTEPPITESPTGSIIVSPPPPCPEDIILKHKVGETEFPVDQAVEILSQDTSTVTVKLTQAWTTATTLTTTNIDHIYAAYKTSIFDQNCYESVDVQPGATYEEEITITCNVLYPVAALEICVADDFAHEVLTVADNAEVPKCCYPSFRPNTPVVCYLLEINCVTECIDETQQRKLSPSSLRAGRFAN